MTGQDSNTSPHPDEQILLAFSSGKLPDAVLRSEVENHLRDCSECLKTIEQLGLDRLELRLRTLDLDESLLSAHTERFELIEEIGRGGGGIVYRARQVGLDRQIALKMLLAGERAGAAELARFHRESAALSRLNHPHIVQIYDFGELDGAPYLALQYIDGPTLAQRLSHGPLDAMTAAKWLRRLAEAVHCAHQAGITHRDLKPQNILLSPSQANSGSLDREHVRRAKPADAEQWTPKLVDFGLAQLQDAGSFKTKTGETLGTPAYLAPEIILGSRAGSDPKLSDIYGLGAVLYECLTGRPPFTGSTSWEILQSVAAREPVSITSLRAGVPRDLVTICTRCLEKRPERRFGSAQELADDLQRVIENRPILSRRVSRIEKTIRWARRRPGLAVTGMLCLLLAMAIPILLLIQKRAVQRERDIARQQYAAARSTLHQLLSELNHDQATSVPQATRLAARQAAHAAALYEQLAAVDDSPQSRLDLGKVLVLQGTIELALGNQPAAEKLLDRAKTCYQAHVDDPEHRRDALAGMFQVHMKRAILYQDIKEFEAATRELDAGMDLHSQLVATTAADDREQQDQRLIEREFLLRNQGNLAQRRGDLSLAAQSYVEALAVHETLGEFGSTNSNNQRTQSSLRINLASIQLQLNQLEQSEANYRTALSELEVWAANHAFDSSWVEAWSGGILNQSNLLAALGRRDEAFATLDAARIRLIEADAKDPGRTDLQKNLFMVTANRAMYCEDPANKAQCWRDAIAAARLPAHIIFSRQMLVRSLANEGAVESAHNELMQIDQRDLDDQQRFVQASCYALIAKSVGENPSRELENLVNQATSECWALLSQLAERSELNDVRLEHLNESDDWSHVRESRGESEWQQLLTRSSR